MDKLMGYCRECRGKGSYKLPGTKQYKLCSDCGGSGQAKIDIEKEKQLLVQKPVKKVSKRRIKVGKIWID